MFEGEHEGLVDRCDGEGRATREVRRERQPRRGLADRAQTPLVDLVGRRGGDVEEHQVAAAGRVPIKVPGLAGCGIGEVDDVCAGDCGSARDGHNEHPVRSVHGKVQLWVGAGRAKNRLGSPVIEVGVWTATLRLATGGPLAAQHRRGADRESGQTAGRGYGAGGNRRIGPGLVRELEDRHDHRVVVGFVDIG